MVEKCIILWISPPSEKFSTIEPPSDADMGRQEARIERAAPDGFRREGSVLATTAAIGISAPNSSPLSIIPKIPKKVKLGGLYQKVWTKKYQGSFPIFKVKKTHKKFRYGTLLTGAAAGLLYLYFPFYYTINFLKNQVFQPSPGPPQHSFIVANFFVARCNKIWRKK